MPDDVRPDRVSAPERSALERASWLGLGLTLTAAVAARFVGLDHLPGINGDEAHYGVHALEWLDGSPLSRLRTGSDLPMNPLFLGVVAGLHAVHGPSALTLRLAALVQSLFMLALSFLLFRRRGLGFAAPRARARRTRRLRGRRACLARSREAPALPTALDTRETREGGSPLAALEPRRASVRVRPRRRINAGRRADSLARGGETA